MSLRIDLNIYYKMKEYTDVRQLNGTLSINTSVLHQMVMDYFTDVYRLKVFHHISNINKTKIIAYELFWLSRRKPIQVCSADTDSRVIFCNEGFAVTILAAELLVPKETEPLSKEKGDAFFKYWDHLYYHFKYRELDKQCFETILLSFEVGKFIANR